MSRNSSEPQTCRTFWCIPCYHNLMLNTHSLWQHAFFRKLSMIEWNCKYSITKWYTNLIYFFEWFFCKVLAHCLASAQGEFSNYNSLFPTSIRQMDLHNVDRIHYYIDNIRLLLLLWMKSKKILRIQFNNKGIFCIPRYFGHSINRYIYL